MKKLIFVLAVVLIMIGCTGETSSVDTLSPFKEYKINDKEVAEMVEEGILGAEAKSKGLVLEKSSAHLIAFERIGEYGKGKVRILGIISEEELEKINNSRGYGERKANDIVNYYCDFEYSYRTGRYTWSNTFPY